VRLSHDKYCSATAMFAKSAEIAWTVQIVDDGTPPAAPA
jgi:uncharacterized OsmC-like protein